MTPPAPPRFSITTVCPRFSDSAGTTLRVTMSVPPPGAAGTTRRIGRVGYCAHAGAWSPETSASSAMNRVTAHLAGDHVAGPRADVVEVELPVTVLLLGPARDQRSPLPEFSGSGEDACLGGALDDDLEPDFFHRALRQRRVLEAGDPLAADLHGRLDVLRTIVPDFLDHVLESRLVVARQDDLVACVVHVDLVQYRGHGDPLLDSGGRKKRLCGRRTAVAHEILR